MEKHLSTCSIVEPLLLGWVEGIKQNTGPVYPSPTINMTYNRFNLRARRKDLFSLPEKAVVVEKENGEGSEPLSIPVTACHCGKAVIVWLTDGRLLCLKCFERARPGFAAQGIGYRWLGESPYSLGLRATV